MRVIAAPISVLALLAAQAAFAGIATFAGSANDTDAQLEGYWVSYQTDGIACGIVGDYDSGYTTNVTSLCGTRSLANLGTITVILKTPNWADAWGAFIYPTLSVGTERKIEFGFGNDWTNQTAYIAIGDQTEATRSHWTHQQLGYSPLGIRLASDGTTLTFYTSGNGVDFDQRVSWSIDNLPGGLGSSLAGDQLLELEIGEYSQAATISSFVWDALTVPCINTPACVGEGEPGFVFTRLPFGGWIEYGTRLELDVEVAGAVAPVTYQWIHNDADTGATSPSYVVESATWEDGGWYFCRVEDHSKIIKETRPTLVTIVPFGSLPVVGLIGISMLTGVCALGGALTLRRKE